MVIKGTGVTLREVMERLAAEDLGAAIERMRYTPRTKLPEVTWTPLVMPPRSRMARLRYWLGDKAEALSWWLRDGA